MQVAWHSRFHRMLAGCAASGAKSRNDHTTGVPDAMDSRD
jgi:hypothetical protein